ncbi:stealth family protein [Rhodohalobacter sp. 614A]|uniref:stealth family protein n=1 Tax=Rhodohalobacter sp. 614A TaxID=2908649 RepID=UPI001F3603BA|nr:stealth family protein [Rhodohalobacter sp. 614A]
MKNEHTQIDAVIAWVDGNDRNHHKKRLDTFRKVSEKEEHSLPTSFDNTRFRDNGELRYCISSIIKFAPWIRNIYVVTDNQVPGFLTPEIQDRYNIHIVDHKDIFESYEWALPTFNTRSIETALWRIPGLAPRFIYFNDDFVITNPVTPEDFFVEGKVVLRGHWDPISTYGPGRLMLNDVGSVVAKNVLGITRSMHLLLQIKSAELAGFSEQYFRIPHVPHPIVTDTLKTFFTKNPELFEENIQYRFRNRDQFSAIFLAHHLEIKEDNAVLRDAGDSLMLNGEIDFLPLINLKLKKIKGDRILFVCLQGLEKFNKYYRQKIEYAFDSMFDAGKKAIRL